MLSTILITVLLSATIFTVSAEPRRPEVEEPQRYRAGFIKAEQLSGFDYTLQSVDTALDNIHRFDPVTQFTFPRIHSGNTGKKHIDLWPKLSHSNVRFRHGFDQFDPYRHTPATNRFYDTYTPFTEANFIQGSRELQLARAIHSQNIRPNWNMAFHLERWRSEGFYFNEDILYTRGGITSNYESLNKRYKLHAGVNWNRFDLSENAGLTDPVAFENASSSDKLRSFVNLDEAGSVWDDKNLFLHQQYSFGYSSEDTIIKDNDTTIVIDHKPEWALFLETGYENYRLDYMDLAPNADFYPDYDGDPVSIADSVWGYNFYNKAGIKTSRYKRSGDSSIARAFHGATGVLFTRDAYKQLPTDTAFSNTGLFLNGAFKYHELDLFWNGTYLFSGPLSGNVTTDISSKIRLPNRVSLHGSAFYEQLKPAFSDQFFNSAILFRNSELEPTQAVGGEASIKFRNFLEAGGNATTLSRYTYFDSDAKPQQHPSDFTVYRAFAGVSLKWSGINLDSRIYWQNSESNVLPVPEWMATGSLYYERMLFDDALEAQIGFDALAFTKFSSYNYMPFTGDWYLGENIRRPGNYPVIDLFVNFRVKQVRIFFKIDHINANYTGNHYYLANAVPHHPAAFRFGLNWLFFN